MSLIDEARTVRERIAARIEELEPLVREYDELSQLAAEMGIKATPAGPAGADQSPAPPQRRPGRSRTGSRSAAEPSDAAGDDLTRRILDAVRDAPGKSVAQYAEDLKLPPTGLYRPVKVLTSSGMLVKRSRLLFPA